MDRRSLLKGTATFGAALAAPGIALGQARTLRFVPQIDLAFLDPHWTTANVTRNHGFMVFDTLYGVDENFAAHPQMAEGHKVEDDGKRWTIRLREGLRFHDGEPVLARDCVASIRRWAARDAFGGALMRATDELSAPDDRTIVFRLKKPFPLLPDALAKTTAMMCAIMPERIARTDPGTQISEVIGSGPYRYVTGERLQGSRNVYARFDGYRPREGGPALGTAGPKVVHFDRVVWTTIPDASTAAAALMAGEQDWYEQVAHDLKPMLARARGVRLMVQEETGTIGMLRPNHTQAPFNNPEIRRVLMRAIDQAAYMQAIVGDDRDSYHVPTGFFCPGTPMASEVALDPLRNTPDFEAVKRDLVAAGYKGEKVVLLVPTDYVTMKAMGDVAADMLRRVGVNLDYLATDWGTMLQRRNNRGPVETGGWSLFVTSWTGTDWINPATHISIRGVGASGYAGWNESPRLEALYSAWFDAPDLAAQQAVCRDIQRVCMEEVPYYPLGQFKQQTALRGLRDLQPGFTKFWGVRAA
ncbi:ABC transporter substrate-binding protein [Roseomonas sp. SSH11]|uniref:ABC transporter substrate-binding protein n=1 Tax=Pararoseomonas baculiformis TaxID=2820812 RepID=A0ABS4AEC3_9PROT|nr:ABC transporter substrate-binding protein [Pararoseomonas baculiformis]MBP0445369.1 ABC transporter substrate-binding protein [Pararoseomonas baculiformis]